jgi:hypothetical protein
MDKSVSPSFSHTADYIFIEMALKARWKPFYELEREFHSFTPRTAANFDEYRQSELARLKSLNPNAPDEDLLTLINGQIQSQTEPGVQIYLLFNDRVMSEYVTVAFLAHALAEATINATLAVGLSTAGSPDLFTLIERADIKEKWLTGSKAFHPTYTLPKHSALYQTLQHLTRQRNAFVHYKIELEMDGERKLEGSRLDRAPLHVQLNWIRRFFSLPYDLAMHAHTQMPHQIGFFLYDGGPIERFAPHTICPQS